MMKFTINTISIVILLTFLFSCKSESSDNVDSKEAKESEMADSIKQKALAQYEKLGIDTKAKSDFEPLAVDTEAPDFSSIDQNGKEHSLSSLTQDGPLVMIFYRGEWCSICNRYLSKFANDLDTLQDLGATVIAVTPEVQDSALRMAEKTGLKIPIISDLDRSIMDAFNVSFRVNEKYQEMIRDRLKTDIAVNNGSDEAYLPIPATYVIGKDKKIKFVHYDPNYKMRASVQNIARHL